MTRPPKKTAPAVLVTMGVSGSGKSYFGRKLAEAMGAIFYEGDDFHPPDNIAKMNRGTPLTDADRLPWLRDLNRVLLAAVERGETVVLACSALRKAYRDILRKDVPELQFIFLKGSHELITRRLVERRGHFMPPDLLESQFQALEEPEDALVVDISQPVQANVEFVREALYRQ